MIQLIFLSFLWCSISSALHSTQEFTPPGPRGVPISKISLYDPSVDFTCLDGTRTIPFTYVNDDYCDCPDGTDEPGTSACPNGIFYCANLGHKGRNIPSSWVNDGFCDCCDGSDEYLLGNCTNKCNVIANEARRRAKELSDMTMTGSRIKLHMSSLGRQIIQERAYKIELLERNLQNKQRVLKAAESVLNETEARERGALQTHEKKKKLESKVAERDEDEKEALEVFTTLDANKNQNLEESEIALYQVFDKNHDGKVSDDEAKFFLGEAHCVNFEGFLKSTWPRMKPFYFLEKSATLEEDDESEPPPLSDEPPEIDNAGGCTREDSFEETYVDDLIEQSKEEVKEEYDEETKRIVEDSKKAKDVYEHSLRVVKDLERELNALYGSISRYYGSTFEFAPLDGHCFQFSENEYKYKFCPFDSISQSPVSGGSEISLGSWKGWERGENFIMVFDGGARCWNGPPRSARVHFVCGTQNALIKVSEPSKCSYLLVFETPAVCSVDLIYKIHDEL